MSIRERAEAILNNSSIEDYHAVIRDLLAELDRWKANHDGMVRRNAVLTQRPDLDITRIPIYEALLAENGRLTKRLKDKDGIINIIVDAFNGVKPPDNYPFAGKIYDLKAENERLEKI